METLPDVRNYRRLKTPRERASLTLIIVAAVVGGAPALIPLIGALYAGGSLLVFLVALGIAWIVLQILCGLCAHRAPRWLAVLMPALIASFMLLLAPLFFFELGPLYLLPGCILWYVVAFRGSGEISLLPVSVQDALERVRRAGE